jgi:RNA-directed DNA polymerase
MAQQKSEDRVVPDGGVMPAKPVGSSARGQGKAIPVDEAALQLRLPIATAEAPVGGSRARSPDRSGARAGARVPKAVVNEHACVPAMMDEVVERLGSALLKVVSNKGAPGPDGMTVESLQQQWPTISRRLSADLLEGRWCPGEIRRAQIPKAGGGQRGLGIPNVADRVVMEAVRQVLEPLFEPTFHPSSHGFRPGRSCHTAVAEAGQHLQDGYGWVVDIDLEKFFDRVNHQRLMARLAKRVPDRRLLVLIGRLLRAKVVLPDGVVIGVDEGVPQGSPLSPLLSNIVLDELDRELARRGLRFVRYADDCNVYVASERAGQRVMASLERFIEGRLRLKINHDKSAVARPEDRHFLGFCLRLDPQSGAVVVLLSQRTRRNAMARIRELTPRNWGGTLESCIHRVNVWLRGWHQFFGIAAASEEFMLRALDAHIRRRLRAIVLKHWRRQRTIARNLVKLGVKRQSAWRQVYAGRKSTWALSHSPAVDKAMPTAFFSDRGLVRLVNLHRRSRRDAIAPVQLQMVLGWE